jgi:hypothetical protein
LCLRRPKTLFHRGDPGPYSMLNIQTLPLPSLKLRLAGVYSLSFLPSCLIPHNALYFETQLNNVEEKEMRRNLKISFSLLIVVLILGLLPGCTKMVHETAIKDSMADMENRALKLGKPTLADDVLYFGTSKINENFEIVDAIQAKYGCTATFFEKQGDKFVRVSTDVMFEGHRAVGTILDPDGPVIKKILNGKHFYGTVDILGFMYETGYEPIIDATGDVIGVYYTGFQL